MTNLIERIKFHRRNFESLSRGGEVIDTCPSCNRPTKVKTATRYISDKKYSAFHKEKVCSACVLDDFIVCSEGLIQLFSKTIVFYKNNKEVSYRDLVWRCHVKPNKVKMMNTVNTWWIGA